MLRVALLLVVAMLAMAGAQVPVQNPPSPPEQPTFHIGVDAVRIDAVVTDAKGQIVTDLTADDFELKDDGRPQKVTLATFVPVASGPADSRPVASNGCCSSRSQASACRPSARARRGPALDPCPGRRPRHLLGGPLRSAQGAPHVHRPEPAADRSGRADAHRHVRRHAATVHDGPAPDALRGGRTALDRAVPARRRALRIH